MKKYTLTYEVVGMAGVVFGDVRYGLERFKEYRESFAMSRIAAIQHHHRLTVVDDVAVPVLRTTYL